jgi:hypothetical protein
VAFASGSLPVREAVERNAVDGPAETPAEECSAGDRHGPVFLLAFWVFGHEGGAADAF